MKQPTFTNAFFQNIRLVPRVALAMMFAVAVVSALIDVAWWDSGQPDLPMGMWLLLPNALIIGAVEYFAVTGVIRTSRSLWGFTRFACTSVAVVLPLLAAFGLLFAIPFIGKGVALALFVLVAIGGFLVVAFLPAWPVAQAVSSGFVSPTRVVRATKGFRWSLVTMALILSAFNRQDLLPRVKDAHDLSHAFAYAAGEAGITALSMIYTAVIAATAFEFARRNDARLWPTSVR